MSKITYKNEFGITCSKCGKPVNMTYTDDPQDGYVTECKCGHSEFIDVYIIDGIQCAQQMDSQRNEEVQKVMARKNIVFHGVKQFSCADECVQLKELKTKGKLVQKLDSYGEIEEWYKINKKYYRVDIDCFGRGDIVEVITRKQFEALL